MDLITFLLVVHTLSFVRLIQAQCDKNGTCICHCTDCSSGCQSCLPGWSGSTKNSCQKANTLYQFYANDSEHIKVLDGNSSSFEESIYDPPFILVRLKAPKVVRRLHITLQLYPENNYTVYVKDKDNKYAEKNTLECNTFSFKEARTIKTISVVCKQPLEGIYIHIVSVLKVPLRVYEIEEFECTNGSFGYDCTGICPKTCSDQCNKETGQCTCKTGFWGTYCNQTCSTLCKDTLCDHNSGVCVDCILGHYGLNCTDRCSLGCQDTCNKTSGFCKCKKGYYSANCSLQCSENCKNSYCLQESGICASCIQVKYGNFCKEDCLGDCGDSCEQDTGLCATCAEGKYDLYCNKTCPIYCEGHNCSRTTGECFDCVKNKYGTYCNNSCPDNCKSKICDRNTGKCMQCQAGFTGEKCQELCPAHCQECTQDGFKCTKCEDGWYGVKCNKGCQESCGGNKTCDIERGLCHVCSVGYFGEFCEKKCNENCDAGNMCDKVSGYCHSCKAGKRGSFCAESCSQNCRNLSCFMNETCIDGCEDGWFGLKCTFRCSFAVPSCDICEVIDDKPVCQQCSDSWFLNEFRCFKCPQNCSSCLSDSECHECKQNLFYGETCHLSCNTACSNKTCDITGQCIGKCENNKYGTECNQDCPVGCRSCHNASWCSSCENGFHMKCEGCPDNSACSECGICVNSNEDGIVIHAEGGLYSIAVLLTLCLLLCLIFMFLIGTLKHKWTARKKPITACINQVEPDLKYRGPNYENTGISLYNTRGSVAFLEEIDQGQPSDDVVEIKEENHVYVNIKITKISISNLWEYKLENTALGTFDTEFKELPSGLLLRTTESTKKENKKRNRYKQIYPCTPFL